MRSNTPAVSKSCSEAFAPKRIQTVVRKIAVKEETMNNVIVYGVSETEGEDVRSKVEHFLADSGEMPVVRNCSRLGSQKEGAVRPIKFTVGCSDHAAQVIRKPETCAL